MSKILLVDDDPQSLESTRKILEFSGYQVVTAVDGQMALEQVRAFGLKASFPFDIVITDVRMPRLGGLEFLRALNLCGQKMPVILMTAFGRVEDAVWAMKLGAVDFLTKPFKRQTLLLSVEAALKRSKPRQSDPLLGSALIHKGMDSLIGKSGPMESLKQLIAKVAPTQVTVLLTGESGTGKELVARCLHQYSSRAPQPFIALNCAAVPEQLMESELFGFEKGAFTGATMGKEGLFESAHGGTLLLDEIGDMPILLQAKLLRVLQEGEVRRLGSTSSKKIDVRVIAATHKNLKQACGEGTFRQDLLYRLEVMGISLPALRERREDISELADFFLLSACRKHGKEAYTLSSEVLTILEAYPWPGNVRELSNVIERAVVLTAGAEIVPSDLPAHLLTDVSSSGESSFQQESFVFSSSSNLSIPLGTPLRDVEELLIRKTLEATSGDKNMTARLLGINSRTIYRKLDKRSLEKDLDSPAEPEIGG